MILFNYSNALNDHMRYADRIAARVFECKLKVVVTRVRSTDQSDHLKGRVAEALLEAIFRRAGYLVSRVGRESQLHRLVKIGVDEFLPDFLIRKQVDRQDGQRPLQRLIPVGLASI